MAYRRRQGINRTSTFKEEIRIPGDDGNEKPSNPQFTSSHSFSASSTNPLSPRSPSESLVAQAIRASAARRESPVFGEEKSLDVSPRAYKGFNAYEDPRNDAKGFWGVLARKAKAILDDDDMSQQFDSSPRARSNVFDAPISPKGIQSYQSIESLRRMDNPTLRKNLDKLTSSLNQIGDTFERAYEEGRSMVENKTADIIQETRKIQIRRKGGYPDAQNQELTQATPLQNQTNRETQIKASRDVAMATAAKAKLLLRELKTVKADFAFAKERCSQLEAENKILRESREKGGNPADDDLIRLQLETLLAEKARLANENSTYARENRFLREIVEFHQLTMQDVVYLDECAEEVSEVNPIHLSTISESLSSTPTSPKSVGSPKSPSSPPSNETASATPPKETKDVPISDATPSSGTSVPKDENAKRPSDLDSPAKFE